MQAMLEMRGISKAYGEVQANQGIDLSVPAGAIVGLLGENGSGKSTLMKVLFGMVRPDAGCIVYTGREFEAGSPKKALAAGIAMIHQHFTLVEAMTVPENLMLGWSRAALRAIAAERERFDVRCVSTDVRCYTFWASQIAMLATDY